MMVSKKYINIDSTIKAIIKMVILLIIIVQVLTSKCFAHGGGLDSNGCHHDTKNGTYHCHRSSNNSLSNLSEEGSVIIIASIVVGTILAVYIIKRTSSGVTPLSGGKNNTLFISPTISDDNIGIAVKYNF